MSRTEYITTHSYARARVPGSRVGLKGGKGVRECPLFILYILKVPPPITPRRRNLQPFSHVTRRGEEELIVPAENRENKFYGAPHVRRQGRVSKELDREPRHSLTAEKGRATWI